MRKKGQFSVPAYLALVHMKGCSCVIWDGISSFYENNNFKKVSKIARGLLLTKTG